jgi:hypothetical protein
MNLASLLSLLIEMNVEVMIKSLAAATTTWREKVIQELQDKGCKDLSYRPSTGMSSLGWLLAHQAAAYDYTLNMLIKGNPHKRPDLFYLYRGDSSDKGDWAGTSLQEINEYYASSENDFLVWFEQASDKELNRILEGTSTPEYYRGK